MAWTIMPASGACIVTPFLPATLRLPIEIGQPVGVGPKARNKPDDVKVIQDALNRVTLEGEPGGPMPFLAVDGICGPKTNAAISRFQQVQLKIFDGVIEPKRKTIVRLNEIVRPLNEADLTAKLELARPIVGAALQAAIRNIEISINGNGAPADVALAGDRLNRHFGLNTLPPERASLARVDLFRSYLRFQTVIMNPESFGERLIGQFDLDGSDPFIALSSDFGFFHPLEEDKGVRLDHIHMGLGFMSARVTPEFAAFVILHELTHFVGRADGVLIDDHGRGWFDEQFMKPLTAEQRLANADSYADFAFECRNNSALKPPFIESRPGGLGGRR